MSSRHTLYYNALHTLETDNNKLHELITQFQQCEQKKADHNLELCRATLLVLYNMPTAQHNINIDIIDNLSKIYNKYGHLDQFRQFGRSQLISAGFIDKQLFNPIVSFDNIHELFHIILQLIMNYPSSSDHSIRLGASILCDILCWFVLPHLRTSSQYVLNEVLCYICGDGQSLTDNIIVECEICRLWYHELCGACIDQTKFCCNTCWKYAPSQLTKEYPRNKNNELYHINDQTNNPTPITITAVEDEIAASNTVDADMNDTRSASSNNVQPSTTDNNATVNGTTTTQQASPTTQPTVQQQQLINLPPADTQPPNTIHSSTNAPAHKSPTPIVTEPVQSPTTNSTSHLPISLTNGTSHTSSDTQSADSLPSKRQKLVSLQSDVRRNIALIHNSVSPVTFTDATLAQIHRDVRAAYNYTNVALQQLESYEQRKAAELYAEKQAEAERYRGQVDRWLHSQTSDNNSNNNHSMQTLLHLLACHEATINKLNDTNQHHKKLLDNAELFRLHAVQSIQKLESQLQESHNARHAAQQQCNELNIRLKQTDTLNSNYQNEILKLRQRTYSYVNQTELKQQQYTTHFNKQNNEIGELKAYVNKLHHRCSTNNYYSDDVLRQYIQSYTPAPSPSPSNSNRSVLHPNNNNQTTQQNNTAQYTTADNIGQSHGHTQSQLPPLQHPPQSTSSFATDPPARSLIPSPVSLIESFNKNTNESRSSAKDIAPVNRVPLNDEPPPLETPV